MKAVLLCAGFATRLYPLTRDRAKPLLPVAGRPILTDLVEQIVATGAFDEIVVVTNGRFFADFQEWARRLAPGLGSLKLNLLNDGVLDQEERLGAVGDLALALNNRSWDEALLVAAGDNVFRFPLEELLADYAGEPRNLVAVHEEEDLEKLRRTGVAEVDGGGRIRRFVEKPHRPPSNLSSAPLYLLCPQDLALVAEFLARHPGADALGSFIAYLVEKRPVFAHRMRGHRYDLGNLESYRRAEAWLKSHPEVWLKAHRPSPPGLE